MFTAYTRQQNTTSEIMKLTHTDDKADIIRERWWTMDELRHSW